MTAAIAKLDLRFADEEDAEEISNLLGEVGRAEGEGDWRSPGPRVSAAEVALDCSSSKSRWIVLETPVPEEAMMAAVRLCLLESERKGVIDVLCALGENHLVYNQLLARVENIARGLGIARLVIEVVQWNEPQYDWLCSCGYRDNAGRECKDENLLKPTMILEMHKDLRQAVESTDLVGESLDELIRGINIGSVEVVGVEGGGAPASMEAIMGDLFSALHREYPQDT